MAHEHQILPHLQLVERIVSSLARRQRLTPADAEDLASTVKLKLLQSNCAALQNLRAHENLESYLAAIVHRQYIDFVIARRGKWRASREAQRLGWIAERLEDLLVNEGRTFGEACQMLRTNDGVRLSDSELDDLYARLPRRTKRHFVSVEVESLGREASVEWSPERVLQDDTVKRVRDALNACTAELGDEDRLLIMLRFTDELQVSVIARTLGLDSKRLYRRLEGIFRQLRHQLEARGVTPADIAAVLVSAAAETMDGSTLNPRLRIRQERPHYE